MMADDLGDSLSMIREHYQQPLVNSLLDIQKRRMRYPKSAEFVQNLECLYLSTQNNISDSTVRLARAEGASQPITFMRRHINAFRQRQYVALSYTWNPPPYSKEKYGGYYVESREGGPLQSKVQDLIDREYIVQEEGEKKEIAVQAMDLVYNRSKHPIGLLYHPTISMAELELLAGLMTMQFGKCGPEFKLPPGLSPESACRTLELLEAIVRDVWWTRA
ncbi:hypothetical protein E0Z10_g10381 [Xylaria hypoxylon]|uniref:Uncharacterized protein n=1 Tax=Xylaria hypoxylon TaxID=37992 RepID=A0A4Z0YP22_9PEZI|nr:hypothetical protein E0Z10_g10381 [Xylaria hypoxylon]